MKFYRQVREGAPSLAAPLRRGAGEEPRLRTKRGYRKQRRRAVSEAGRAAGNWWRGLGSLRTRLRGPSPLPWARSAGFGNQSASTPAGGQWGSSWRPGRIYPAVTGPTPNHSHASAPLTCLSRTLAPRLRERTQTWAWRWLLGAQEDGTCVVPRSSGHGLFYCLAFGGEPRCLCSKRLCWPGH